MRAWPAAALAIVGSVAFAACGQAVLPVPPELGTKLVEGFAEHAGEFTVTPWPIPQTTAYLCQDDPGARFRADVPVPPAEAGCVPMDLQVTDGVLTARLPRERLTPLEHAALDRDAPWFLALRGTAGGTTVTRVYTIENSPFPSDPGPS